VARLLDTIKEREAIGYAYESADASFDLLARRMLGKVPSYFDVTQFDVNVEQRINAKGADRKQGRDRRQLDHGRGVREHHRSVVRGADGFNRLQAGEIRSAGLAP
jgi:hypothetical protein